MSEFERTSHPDRDPTGEEGVRESLMEAGRREPLPASDLAIIKAAARHEWEELGRASGALENRRRSRRYLALAAVLLIAILSGWWIRQSGIPAAAMTVATVEVASDHTTGLTVGSGVVLGTAIEVDSPIALRLAGGQSLRVAADSSLQFMSEKTIRLNRGAVYVDSGPSVLGEGVEIETNVGVVREVGTQFEVRIGTQQEPLRVRVREGEVIVRTNGESRSAVAGEELALEPNGTVRRGRVPVSDAGWEWTETLAPPFVMEGSSLLAYLEWLTRETGWQIEFNSQDLETTVAEIVLHGSLEGLSPRQTVDDVLTGSGLSYSIENTSLIISSP